jgi:hypothetical protein
MLQLHEQSKKKKINFYQKLERKWSFLSKNSARILEQYIYFVLSEGGELAKTSVLTSRSPVFPQFLTNSEPFFVEKTRNYFKTDIEFEISIANSVRVPSKNDFTRKRHLLWGEKGFNF